MVDPQATRFWHSAMQSGLIDASALETCWNAIPQEKRTPDAADRRLARQTVSAGHLTHWQASQILAGRSVGFRIDKYILLDRIGHGGMGRVYLAKDTRLNRKVALKVLSPERMNNPRALVRFLREAKVGAQLQHENLVRIYDEGESNGVRYLVMEYIEGKNAGQIVSQHGPMAPPIAAKLVRQVALGLEHAHQKGLIHRDVNPWNILVTRDGTAKLTDLGLAIDLADSDDAVTRDGATVGTFDYISPEQARHSRSVDTRSDIYSLGCTLFHLLSGRVPFALPSLPEKLYAHQLTEAESLSTLVPAVPKALDDVVRRMMKKLPEERFQEPGDVARALEPFLDGATTVPGVGNPVGPSTAARTSSQGTPADSAASPAKSAATTTSPAASGLSPAPDPGDSQLSEFPGAASSDPDFHKLITDLDFGPELPLTESVSTIKYRQGIDWGDRRQWIAVGAAAAVLLLIFGAAMALRGCGPDSGSTVSAVAVPSVRKTVPAGNAKSPDSTPLTPVADVSVFYSNGEQRPIVTGDPYNDLHQAIQSAASTGAEVVLRNRKPFVLKASRSLTSQGSLVIRAAQNEQPTLLVELAGKEPFLLGRSDSSVELRGLTIQVVYLKQNGPLPPLIRAAGNLILDHCSISILNGVRGARAALVEGLETSVVNCWFEGFDPAIDMVLHAQSRVRLTHSMIVGGDSAGSTRVWDLGGSLGRGTGDRSTENQIHKRSLEIDHCTLTGEGMLALDGFTAQSPLTVDIKDSVVQARALLQWKAGDANTLRQGVRWSGKGNHYDVSGDAWVALPPKGESNLLEPLPDGPASLEQWVTMMPNEIGAKKEELRFSGGGSQGVSRGPKDFAPPEPNVGANPSVVGPQQSSGQP
jgi:eukaryotic-like serine/threonine-protein kinase